MLHTALYFQQYTPGLPKCIFIGLNVISCLHSSNLQVLTSTRSTEVELASYLFHIAWVKWVVKTVQNGVARGPQVHLSKNLVQAIDSLWFNSVSRSTINNLHILWSWICLHNQNRWCCWKITAPYFQNTDHPLPTATPTQVRLSGNVAVSRLRYFNKAVSLQ